MNKKKKGRKLSLKTDQRKALLKSLAANLILNEKIKTTVAKAKETATFVEKLITVAKKLGLPSRKRLSELLPEKAAIKLAKELASRYSMRQGGYTRIIKTGRRPGDAAQMAIIELLR